MSERYDAVILGMGPGGEAAAGVLLAAGRRVAVVERELIGGECAYWACIPSKTLLRPPEVRIQSLRAHGVGAAATLDWAATAAYRDEIIRHLDDSGSKAAYEKQGATVYRGAGRLAGPGRVEVGGQVLETEHVIVATGSEAVIPPIEGLDDCPVWTNREATTMTELPRRVLLVGGGPVGLELAQMMRGFGCEVALVHNAPRLIDREEPPVSQLIARVFSEDGIDVHLGCHADRVRREGEDRIVELGDGSEVATDVIVVATGRSPRVDDIGLDTIGVEAGRGGLAVDEACRVADGVWAVGDVTGLMPFTHVAIHQGKVVASNVLGGSRRADLRGVPRVVFSDPEIAAAGLTREQAEDQGLNVATAHVDLAQAIPRPVTYEREPRGELGLIADRNRGVLVGAWIVAPLASEWIHTPATAIRAEIPIETLRDGVAQFPTFTQGYYTALEQLEL